MVYFYRWKTFLIGESDLDFPMTHTRRFRARTGNFEKHGYYKEKAGFDQDKSWLQTLKPS
jgi:hypothetical protein